MVCKTSALSMQLQPLACFISGIFLVILLILWRRGLGEGIPLCETRSWLSRVLVKRCVTYVEELVNKPYTR